MVWVDAVVDAMQDDTEAAFAQYFADLVPKFDVVLFQVVIVAILVIITIIIGRLRNLLA